MWGLVLTASFVTLLTKMEFGPLAGNRNDAKVSTSWNWYTISGSILVPLIPRIMCIKMGLRSFYGLANVCAVWTSCWALAVHVLNHNYSIFTLFFKKMCHECLILILQVPFFLICFSQYNRIWISVSHTGWAVNNMGIGNRTSYS